MRNHLNSALVVFCFSLASSVAEAAINRPDCAALQHWAESRSTNLFEPRPGFSVNTLFEDHKVIPLFGSPLPSWDKDDLSLLQRFLFQCRKQAMASDDRNAGDALYMASTETQRAGDMLNAVWSTKHLAEQEIKHLLELKSSSALPTILSIAEASLKGGDAGARVSELSTQWQSEGRRALELADHHKMLSIEDIASLLAKLETKRNEMAKGVVAPAPEQTSIAFHSDPETKTLVETAGYDEQSPPDSNKQTTATRPHAKAESLAPAPALKRLNAILEGDSVDEVTIRGLSPGVAYPEIKAAAERLWAYVEGNSIGDVDKQLRTKSSDFERLLQSEGRDGGLLNLRTQSGVVGKMTYIEHFSSPIEFMPLREALITRFGKPGKEKQQNDDSLVLTWQVGKRYLQIQVGNKIVTSIRPTNALHSAMQISLWTQDFADYLTTAAQRCEKLRSKPVGELSVNDKQAIAVGCLTP